MRLGRGAKEKPKKSAPLPTGTVTFLFTDIEGSTQRWEQHRAGMDAAIKRHDALMRSVAEWNNGYVFKTVGDAFCVAFTRVSDAVATAIDAQRSLSAEDFSAVGGLPVRMGLHSGETSEDNGDYFGPAVNRVTRLMSIGHGGQILLSGVTRDLVHNDLPTGASLIDLGLHRLKDLTEPEQVWQLNIAGLPAEFPPLKSLDTLPNNLRLQVTTFRGREQDLNEVKRLLTHHRLLTLSGAGGIGKTRLAAQVGADVLEQFPDGVWIAELAPITDPELVSSVVAKVLGVGQVEGRRVDESIPQWLKRKNLLLILDNCEHLLEAVALLADAIHRNCPSVSILATSRQPLGIDGEEVWRLASLAVPQKVGGLAPAAAIQFGAVAVFIDRASSADKSFHLTTDNAPIVSEICRRLDGIPLAIELAAARVKVLSITNLAQRLDDRFKILTSGTRTALPRQKTLAALIDWSYDLLTRKERSLFGRLGIFAGGFRLDAATAVCSGDGVDEVDILDLLSSLTDKSLVMADTGGERECYRLLESTRAYALEKLASEGKREQLARRHGEYFRDQAQAADERYGTGSTFAWLADVESDLDNYRAALEWGLTKGNDVVIGGTIAGALLWLWYRGDLTVEGRYWIEPALERVSEAEQPLVAARLRQALAILSSGRRSYEAAAQAVRLYESVGDDRKAASARRQLAWSLCELGRLEEASESNLQALAVLRGCGDKAGVAICLNLQAAIAKSLGDFAAGRELNAQAFAAYEALGNEVGTAVALSNLAELEFADGHPDRALRLSNQALEIRSRGKRTTGSALGHTNSAAYRLALGDVDGARESAREALSLARQTQDAQDIAIALQHFALIAALRRQAQSAARLVGYVDAQFKELGLERDLTEKWGHEKLMDSLREQLSEAEVERLAAEGAVCSEDQAVQEAFRV